MAQVGWVYLDDYGGRHRIGLYHGDRSGHVVIHCDLRVIQIDFQVKESRTYSFFVEDELCEIGLHRETDRFTYTFEVNKKVDTPRNRARKVEDRRNQRYLAALIAGLAFFIIATLVGFRWYNLTHGRVERDAHAAFFGLSEKNKKRLQNEGVVVLSRLYIIEEFPKRRVVYDFITADSILVSSSFSVKQPGLILLPNGFPLGDKDEFSLTYLPANPQINSIDVFKPSPNTLERYIQLAAAAELAAHPGSTAARSLCVAQIAVLHTGWTSLADLIHQAVSPKNNPAHNSDTYLRLIRDPEMARKLQEACWDK